MKKLLNLLLATVILGSTASISVACSKKIFEKGTDLRTLSTYDWSSSEEPYEAAGNLTSVSKDSKVSDLGTLKVENTDSIYDLSKYTNSGFKTDAEIQKQATTGSPLNTKFLPNGQRVRDFEKVSRENYYLTANEILNWDYDKDPDAKYNTSRISLQESSKVSDKWVSQQSSDAKEMNMATIMPHTSNQNSVIGNNRTYSRSFNNYEYNDITVSWAGSASEGIIVPPAKNETEKAHINGTKILGNIFLDGYHGLTKQMTTGLLKTDSDGNYLIVDKLLEMAEKMGFDGWFWNNEPNGAQPDGTILPYKTVVKILQQLQDKINSNSKYSNLIIFSYKNQGTLQLDSNGNAVSEESQQLAQNANYFLNDFYVFPNEIKTYTDENQDVDPYSIFNMYNMGGWVDGKEWYSPNNIYDENSNTSVFGTRDFRELTNLATDKDGNYYDISKMSSEELDSIYEKEGFYFKDKTDGDELSGTQNSLALFDSLTASDFAESKLDKNSNIDNDTYALVLQNQYDDMVYTGANLSLSTDDKGISSYPSNDLYGQDTLDYSYGVGDVIQEKTTLVDSNSDFETNFSTGQGRKFVTKNGDGKFDTIDDYAWSNTNIADVQPTYKWKVSATTNNETQTVNVKDGISGYYDYYDPYLKGNSIALGSGFDQKGEIQSASFDKDTNYDWTIMGANYTKDSGSKTITITYKETFDSENSTETNVQLLINGETVSNSSTTNESNDSGWKTITATVSGEISSIGIRFKGSEDKFKFNVGQITVKQNSNKSKSSSTNNETSVYSEYVVDRDGYKNIRLNFSDILDDSIYSYYEIYTSDKTDGSDLKLKGFTNSDNYYIKNVEETTKEIYVKVIEPSTNTIKWMKIEL